MKCPTCRHEMKSTREAFRYEAVGLPGVVLADVEVRRCPNCGETSVSIPRIEDLHRVIAWDVIQKPERLTPEEVRFLRKYLGFSSADFAAHLGVAPETASRWETGAQAMGVTADRLLRLMVATREPVKDYALQLPRVATLDPKPTRLRLRAGPSGWAAA